MVVDVSRVMEYSIFNLLKWATFISTTLVNSDPDLNDEPDGEEEVEDKEEDEEEEGGRVLTATDRVLKNDRMSARSRSKSYKGICKSP